MAGTPARPPAAANLDVQVSLGYKLLLGLAATVLIWAIAGVTASALSLSLAGHVVVAYGAPVVLSLVLGAWYVRTLRTRFDSLFLAATRLSQADWETTVATERGARLRDEVDVMLAHLERIRQNTKDTLQRIDEAGQRVHSSSVGLGQTAQNIYRDLGTFGTALESLRRGAEDQSRNAEAMQAAMDATSAEADNHRRLAHEAEASSDTIRQKVLEDARTMGSVLENWEHTLDELRGAGEGIADFEDTAHAIADIVGIIGEIAERTHTLSLNASLEAVRAGDQGEGFAVLAVEIRSLAADTSRRAETIGGMLQTFLENQRLLLKRLWHGVSGMDESRRAVADVRGRMQEIVAAIEVVAVRIVRLARGFEALNQRIAATREQAETVLKISHAHAQLTRDTVTESRNQMLVGADLLLHEARNLDRIARDLTAVVREIRGGAA